LAVLKRYVVFLGLLLRIECEERMPRVELTKTISGGGGQRAKK
jgi:hypothetical protein